MAERGCSTPRKATSRSAHLPCPGPASALTIQVVTISERAGVRLRQAVRVLAVIGLGIDVAAIVVGDRSIAIVLGAVSMALLAVAFGPKRAGRRR